MLMSAKEIQECGLDSSNEAEPKDDLILSTICKDDNIDNEIGKLEIIAASDRVGSDDTVTIATATDFHVESIEDDKNRLLLSNEDGDVNDEESNEDDNSNSQQLIDERDFNDEVYKADVVNDSFLMPLLKSLFWDVWFGMTAVSSLQSLWYAAKFGGHLLYYGRNIIYYIKPVYYFISVYIYPFVKVVIKWIILFLWNRIYTIMGFVKGSVITMVTMLASLTMITMALAWSVIHYLFVEPLVKSFVIKDDDPIIPGSSERRLVSQDSHAMSDALSILTDYMYTSTAALRCDVRSSAKRPTVVTTKTRTTTTAERMTTRSTRKMNERIESHSRIETSTGLMVSINDRIERLRQKQEHFQRTEDELSSVWSDLSKSAMRPPTHVELNHPSAEPLYKGDSGDLVISSTRISDLWQRGRNRRSSSSCLNNSISQFSRISEHN